MGTLIDSSIFVAVERQGLHLDAIIEHAATEPVAISAVTASELLHGVHRAQDEDRRQRREAFVERILAAVPVIGFDLITARVHARLAAELRSAGTPVGAHDLLIGATAIALGYQLSTRDLRSYPRIPGLRVVQW